MRIVKIIALSISVVAFVLSFPFDSAFLTAIGIPALVFIFQMLHECSHVIGCKIIRTKVNYIETFGFRLSKEKRLEITNRLTVFGCVNFNRSADSWVVYLMGLIGSMIFTGVATTLYFCNVIGNIYAITIGICMVILLIPHKGSDLVRVFERQ